MTDHSALIESVFRENGLSEVLNDEKIAKLNSLANRVASENKKINLTAITSPEDIILKHLVDSCVIVKYIPENARVLDVGTGGGFPALPAAIVRPDVYVVALDSTVKKLKFVGETAECLGLCNVEILPGRAEELANKKEYREAFDVVTARAVASLNVLCELCIPFVKIGGCFLAMKGLAASEESDSARSAAAQLGGGRFRDEQLILRHNDAELQRHILISDKIKPSPDNFPRLYNRIIKKPL